MANLYDAMVQALRQHWKQHDNTYPQCFELTAADVQALNRSRQLVNETMNFKLPTGWEGSFLGAPLRVGAVNVMVTASGERLPIVLSEPEAS